MVSPDGTVSVLLTNLFDTKEFSKKELIDLYFKRWEVENYYRDEKVFLEIEKFHSKTPNGIRQELFAIMVMSLITRILMSMSEEDGTSKPQEYKQQFKNAIMTLSSEMAFFVSGNPVRAIEIFKEMICEIRRVKFYQSKKPRPSQPRICKRPFNKWADKKIKTLTCSME